MSVNNSERQKSLEKLVKELGFPYDSAINFELLDIALIHPSYSEKNNYQQLEFIGDSVVRLAAVEVLWEIYPDASVGEFTALRAEMVSDRTLAEFAEQYSLENYLKLSTSAARDEKGRCKRLADAFESILGALYLCTHTLELIRPWLDPLLIAKAAEIRQDPARHNYKDALQQWTQAHYHQLPEYRVQEATLSSNEGKQFIAQVWCQGQSYGRGVGRTKKEAEQAAAKESLSMIKPD